MKKSSQKEKVIESVIPERLELSANSEVTESALHKELDLIQGVITRMAQNSFQVKTWFLGGISAIAAFGNDSLVASAASDQRIAIILTIFLIIIVFTFWYLDSFFLSTERLYRELYKWVTKNRPHVTKYLYNLNTFKREDYDEKGNLSEVNLIKPNNSIGKVMRSKTLWLLYLPTTLFAFGLLIYNLLKFTEAIK